MSVYVDNFRAPNAVGKIRGRWSHLTADTPDELHTFADSIGLHRKWFQNTCRWLKCPEINGVCAHFHYDVTDSVRDKAIKAGAKAIDIREMGAITSARRAQYRGGAS